MNSSISTINIDFEDVFEPKVFEDGEEQLLRIAKCAIHESQTGNISLKVTFEHPTDPEFEDIIEYFGLPQGDARQGGLDRKKDNRAKKRIKLFQDCFGVNVNQIDFSIEQNQAVGCEGYCILGKETDEQYGDRNRLKQFLVSK